MKKILSLALILCAPVIAFASSSSTKMCKLDIDASNNTSQAIDIVLSYKPRGADIGLVLAGSQHDKFTLNINLPTPTPDGVYACQFGDHGVINCQSFPVSAADCGKLHQVRCDYDANHQLDCRSL